MRMITVCLLVAAIALTTGCPFSSDPDHQSSTPRDEASSAASARIIAVLPKTTTMRRIQPDDVARMILHVTWDGGEVGPVEMFEYAPDHFTIVVVTLPVGTPCDLAVEAFDAADVLIYSGGVNDVTFIETEMRNVTVNLTAVDSGVDEGRGPHINIVARPTADIPAGMIVVIGFVVSDPDDSAVDYTLTSTGDGSFDEPSGTIEINNGTGVKSVRYTTPSAPGTAEVTLTVTDAAGLIANFAFTLTLVEPPALSLPGAAYVMSNFPPTVHNIHASQHADSNQLVLLADVTDDGTLEDLSYSWEIDGALYATGNPITHPRDEGIVTVGLTVADAQGAATTLQFALDTATTVGQDIPLGNQAPHIDGATISTVEASFGDTVVCHVYASDPDAEPLGADWTTDHGAMGATSVEVYGDTYIFRGEWQADVDAGVAHVTIDITDDSLASVSYTFEIDETLGMIGVSADAGDDQEAFVNGTALLDGSGSASDDGVIETYLWEQLGGPDSTIVLPDSEQTEVLLTVAGTYVYRLTVENINNSASDTVALMVIEPTIFTFDDANIDQNGVIYFLDLGADRVRRYNAVNRQFLPSYATGHDVTAFSVAPTGDVIYVGYGGGAINTIDVTTGERTYFASAAAQILCMIVADDYLFTIDSSGYYDNTHSVYHRITAARTDAQDGRRSYGVAYASAVSTVFHLRDGTSPNDIYRRTIDQQTGLLGPDDDSPYHSSSYSGHPIRVFPDDSKVAVRSGIVLDTSDLSHVGTMPFSYTDLAFHSYHIYLLRNVDDVAELVQLDSNFQVLNVSHYEGEGLRVFTVEDELILVHDSSEPGLKFTHINLNP